MLCKAEKELLSVNTEMNTFKQFLDQRFLLEVGPPAGGAMPPPPPGGGGLGAPGALPGGPPMGMPPPPMGGGMGGMGGPPMGGGAPPGQQQGANKLKAYNVWDILEKVLGN